MSQFLVAASIVCMPVWAYLSHSMPLETLANADMLAVPAWVEVVKADGWQGFTNWYWPPAPYFLTDYVLYVPIWLVLPNPWLAPAVFMVAQLTLLFIFMQRLAKSLFPKQFSGSASWGATLSFGLLVFLATDPAAVLARFILVSYYRAGNVILTIIVLTLLAQWTSKGQPDGRRKSVAALGLLSVAAAASDPLQIASLMGPLVGIVLVLSILPKRHGGWPEHRVAARTIGASITVGSIVGFIVNHSLSTSESNYGPALSGSQVRTQAHLAFEAILAVDRTLAILALLAMVLSVALALFQWRNDDQPLASPLLVAVGLIGLSFGGHVAAFLIDTNPPSVRYLIVPMLIPVAMLGPVVAVVASRFTSWPLTPVIAIASAALPIATAVLQLHTPPAPDWSYQPPGAECLDQVLSDSNYDHGLSGYWQARFLPLHSTASRYLAPTNILGDPERINSSSDWFDHPYDYAIVRTSQSIWDPPITLIKALAPDSAVHECGAYTIIDAGRSGLDMGAMTRPGGWISYNGCALGTDIGKVNEECVIEVPVAAKPGFGSFGGYTPLSPGGYTASITFSSTAEPGSTLGSLEVVRVRRIGPDIEVVATYPLTADGQSSTFTIPIEVPNDGERFMLEVRTLSDGEHPYQVESVRIENP